MHSLRRRTGFCCVWRFCLCSGVVSPHRVAQPLRVVRPLSRMLLRVSSQARGTDVEYAADVRPVTTTAQKTEPPVPQYVLISLFCSCRRKQRSLFRKNSCSRRGKIPNLQSVVDVAQTGSYDDKRHYSGGWQWNTIVSSHLIV